MGVPERRRLRVLVDVGLPPHRRDRAERATAVDRAGSCARSGGRARAPGCARPRPPGTHASRRRPSCCCAPTSSACASGSSPSAEQRDEQRRDQRAERGARHVARRDRGRAARRRRSTSVGERAAAPDRDDVGPGVAARPSPSTASPRCRPSTTRANTSVCGPTNAGVRYCLSTVTGTGSAPLATAASTSPAMPDPPMPSTTMLRDVVGRRERGGRPVAASARPALVSARRVELLRAASARPRSRKLRASSLGRRRDRPSRHASKVGRMPSASACATQPLVLGVARRSRPRRRA